MADNRGLGKAREAKKDEFYTSYEDIQAELNYYEGKFEGKTVLCNCDDPFESNFCKFFLKNFNYLHLKRLICTSYSGSPVIATQMSLFDDDNTPVTNKHGYVIDVDKVPMKNGRGVTDDDIYKLLHSKQKGVKKLHGNGDFHSNECIDYLKQCDIVVTNPPFSLFRDYLTTITQFNKLFLIIGNINAVTYKEVFPLLQENRLWLGASIHSGDRKFYVPDNYPLDASGCGIDEKSGRKFIRVKGVRWYTNIDYKERHDKLVLYKHYRKEEFPTYDNYNAINVNKTYDIPMDYAGEIGVPITFMDKYSPDQFEIIGSFNNSHIEDKGKEHYVLSKDTPTIINGVEKLWNGPVINKKPLYKRIVVRNKYPEL